MFLSLGLSHHIGDIKQYFVTCTCCGSSIQTDLSLQLQHLHKETKPSFHCAKKSLHTLKGCSLKPTYFWGYNL